MVFEYIAWDVCFLNTLYRMYRIEMDNTVNPAGAWVETGVGMVHCPAAAWHTACFMLAQPLHLSAMEIRRAL